MKLSDIKLSVIYLDYSNPGNLLSLKKIEEITQSDDYKAKLKKEFLDKLANPTSPIVSVEKEELRRWYGFLLTSDLNAPKEKVTPILLQQVSSWDKIIPFLATHHGKLFNPKSGSCFWPTPQEKETASPILPAPVFPGAKSLSYSGSASYLGKRGLIETEFLYGDEVVSVFYALREKREELLNPLLELGLSKDKLEGLSDLAKAESCDYETTINDDLPQVLFPVGESEEKTIAITPMPSVTVLNQLRYRRSLEWVKREEFNDKLEKEAGKGKARYPFVSFDYTLVGGANSQNSGSFNMMCGGRQFHLVSKIPKISLSRSRNILNRLRKWKTLFYEYRNRENQLDKEFEKELSHLDNQSQRARIEARAEWALGDFAKDALALQQLISQGVIERVDLESVEFKNSLEKKLYFSWLDSHSNRLTQHEAETLAHELSYPVFFGNSMDFLEKARPIAGRIMLFVLGLGGAQ